MELKKHHLDIIRRMISSKNDFPYTGYRGGYPRHWKESFIKGHIKELENAGYLREKEYFNGFRWVLTQKAKNIIF